MNIEHRIRALDAHKAALMGEPVCIPLGKLRKVSVQSVADQAARAIADLDMTLSVTLCPDGNIAIEESDAAVEDDIVGTYRGSAVFTLTRSIYADLRHELDVRQNL